MILLVVHRGIDLAGVIVVFAWLMFLPGSVHMQTVLCVEPRVLLVGCLRVGLCVRQDVLSVLASVCSLKVGYI
jgi:hypothetical protein